MILTAIMTGTFTPVAIATGAATAKDKPPVNGAVAAAPPKATLPKVLTFFALCSFLASSPVTVIISYFCP